jgi:hypothetical protein
MSASTSTTSGRFFFARSTTSAPTCPNARSKLSVAKVISATFLIVALSSTNRIFIGFDAASPASL